MTTLENIVDQMKLGKDTVIMMAGDSITWGRNYCENEETFTAKVAQRLAFNYRDSTVLRYDGTYERENEPLSSYGKGVLVQLGKNNQTICVVRNGIGGDTVSRALRRIDDYCVPFINDKKADLIFTMLGINDALKGDPQKYVNPDEYLLQYRQLLQQIHNRLPDTAIVLMTPTYNDLGKEPISVLREYCEKVFILAKEYNLPLLDMHDMWMKHLVPGEKNFGQGDWLSNNPRDSAHATPKAHEIMAQKIMDLLQ